MTAATQYIRCPHFRASTLQGLEIYMATHPNRSGTIPADLFHELVRALLPLSSPDPTTVIQSVAPAAALACAMRRARSRFEWPPSRNPKYRLRAKGGIEFAGADHKDQLTEREEFWIEDAVRKLTSKLVAELGVAFELTG